MKNLKLYCLVMLFSFIVSCDSEDNSISSEELEVIELDQNSENQQAGTELESKMARTLRRGICFRGDNTFHRYFCSTNCENHRKIRGCNYNQRLQFLRRNCTWRRNVSGKERCR